MLAALIIGGVIHRDRNVRILYSAITHVPEIPLVLVDLFYR